MKTAIFTTITLLTMGLSAGTSMTCKNGVCIVDLSHLSNNKRVKKAKNFRHSFKFFIKKDKNRVETIILPHRKYVMTPAEKERYYGDKIQLIVSPDNVDKKIMKKITLPTSEFFCGKEHKNIVYHSETDSFECA